MHWKNFIYIIFSFMLLAALLLGCKPKTNQQENFSAGLANPASVYCQGLGFQEEIREDEFGQYGVCSFPDGSECGTWDFLAGRCGQEHSYCVDQGHEIQAEKDSSIATCIFDDGSTCNEYLYFEGECTPEE